MKCLRCDNVEMKIKVQQDGEETFEIDICPKCDGIWLDRHELTKLNDSFFVDLEKIPYNSTAPTPLDAIVTCKRCEQNPTLKKVYPHNYKQVVVDICPKCGGFWLDKNEINILQAVSDRLLFESLD